MHTTARTAVPPLLIVALLFSAGAPAEPAPAPRTIAVGGTAQVTIEPDIAYINMSVVKRDPSVTAAQQAAGEVTNRVLGLLDRLGVDRRQVNTTGAQIRPDYRWNRDRDEQELLGYIVERNIRVELRDLQTLGLLIEQASTAGINQLSAPQLDSTRRREAYRDALKLAVADARANAAVIAAAAGGTLGDTLSIGAGQAARPPDPRLRLQADATMARESVPESFTPGELKFTATVNAIYELLDE